MTQWSPMRAPSRMVALAPIQQAFAYFYSFVIDALHPYGDICRMEIMVFGMTGDVVANDCVASDLDSTGATVYAVRAQSYVVSYPEPLAQMAQTSCAGDGRISSDRDIPSQDNAFI